MKKTNENVVLTGKLDFVLTALGYAVMITVGPIGLGLGCDFILTSFPFHRISFFSDFVLTVLGLADADLTTHPLEKNLRKLKTDVDSSVYGKRFYLKS